MTLALLHRVEMFCTAHRLSHTTFGRQAIGDAHLVRELRAGRVLHPRTHERVVKFMRAYKPLEPAREKREPDRRPDARIAEPGMFEGSQALLRALWRSHPEILRYAHAAGRHVEAPR
jgi:hypothetical protein